MNSKAFLPAALGLLLLGGLLAEYALRATSFAVLSSPKIAATVSQSPEALMPLPPLEFPPPASVEQPLVAREEGYRRIAALQFAGEFEAAARVAIDGPAETHRDWIIAAYHPWGVRQPEPAFASATQIQDPTERETALQSVFSGWAKTDPEGLAELALERPEGPEKSAALTKAMRAWLNEDPWKAGDWIAVHEATIPVAEKMFRDDRR